MSKPALCVECGKPPPEESKLNRKGYCYLCSYRHAREAGEQLHAHSGPYYDRWKQAMQAKIGRL